MNDREKNKVKPADSLTIIREIFTTAFWRFESPAWGNNEEEYDELISKSEINELKKEISLLKEEIELLKKRK